MAQLLGREVSLRAPASGLRKVLGALCRRLRRQGLRQDRRRSGSEGQHVKRTSSSTGRSAAEFELGAAGGGLVAAGGGYIAKSRPMWSVVLSAMQLAASVPDHEHLPVPRSSASAHSCAPTSGGGDAGAHGGSENRIGGMLNRTNLSLRSATDMRSGGHGSSQTGLGGVNHRSACGCAPAQGGVRTVCPHDRQKCVRWPPLLAVSQAHTSQPTTHVFGPSMCPEGQCTGACSTCFTPRFSHICSIDVILSLPRHGDDPPGCTNSHTADDQQFRRLEDWRADLIPEWAQVRSDRCTKV